METSQLADVLVQFALVVSGNCELRKKDKTLTARIRFPALEFVCVIGCSWLQQLLSMTQGNTRLVEAVKIIKGSTVGS
jgi:hypothetical protein